MSGRFFLDTNIFAYTFDPSAPAKANIALQLVRRAADTGEGVISYQVVQEFINVALRRFTQPMNLAEAEQYFVTVLRPLLAVDSSPALYLEAFRLVSRHRLNWYDSLILSAALQAGCDTLYTEDFQHGRKIDNLTISNPFVS
jgi:predicted nucleic acid-binding protein